MVHFFIILIIKIIGIEPCKNIAKITKKKYKTIDKYWNKKLARNITRNKKSDLIYSANTLSLHRKFRRNICSNKHSTFK